MKLKKLMALTLAGVMVCSMAGCGDSGSQKASDNAQVSDIQNEADAAGADSSASSTSGGGVK